MSVQSRPVRYECRPLHGGKINPVEEFENNHAVSPKVRVSNITADYVQLNVAFGLHRSDKLGHGLVDEAPLHQTTLERFRCLVVV